MQNLANDRSSDGIDAEGVMPPLRFLWLEVTRKCNLTCNHCYEDSSPRLPLLGSLKTQDWIDILQQASELGVQMVQFIGGEPTLHPDLGLMIKTAAQLGMEIEVYTNGTAISDDLWSVFTEHEVRLAFSYYSVIPQEHDAMTTRPGSHKKTRAAIVKALALELNVRVGVVIMPETERSLDATVSEMKELGVPDIGVDRARGVGRGIVSIETARNPFGELCGQCGTGKLAIDNSGNIHPCVFSKFAKLGKVSDDLESVARGEKLMEFLKKLRKQQEDTRGCCPDPSCPPTNCDPSGGCSP